MEIKEQFSTVIRLLSSVGFPSVQLSFETYLNAIKEKFNFETLVKKNVNPPQLITVEFQKGNAHTIDIMKFAIEGRKLVIDTNSDTEGSIKLIQEITEFIETLTKKETVLVYETYSTEFLSKLSADYDSIFDSRFLKAAAFLNEQIPDTTEMKPFSIRTRVLFHTPNDLVDQKINLSEKDFILEKIENPDNDNLIHSVVPAKTDTHIQLLEMIEELFPYANN